jgi:two-component system CheB/CheR fusion protein
MDDLTQKPSVHRDIRSGIRSSLDFPVVGIGASAGGLEALQVFFEGMPESSGMAFVVILHLSPNHESNAAAILQRVTKIPVTSVNQPTSLEKTISMSSLPASSWV